MRMVADSPLTRKPYSYHGHIRFCALFLDFDRNIYFYINIYEIFKRNTVLLAKNQEYFSQ